ncbi:hypothetical protein WJX82_005741 [Trebouxia sp. C0006]
MVKAEPGTQDLFGQARKFRAQKASAERGTSQALLQAQTKQWLAVREKRLPLPPLSPKVLAFIKEWYFLVDTDGSGELSLDEVAAAMRASGIPHTTQTVEELFNLVDIDGSGIMEWSEFETFVANEIQEGRDFMEGEFVLPSGAGIQFAAMVDVLRRKSRLAAVMKGGNARETTVAKMVEEVEAHALYERTSALMRAAGSRRIPKLRSSPSSPTGWALSTQQSVQAMQSHKLTEDASSLDSTCSSVSSALLNSEKQYDSQKDNDGLSHVARQPKECWPPQRAASATQDQRRGKGQPVVSASTLSFDPSSGGGALKSGVTGQTAMLRSDLAAEMAAVGLFKGRRLVAAGNRPDLDYFKDQEKGHLQQLKSLMPGYRARPSLLGPVAAAAGLSLGAAAGLLPTKLSHAITGATQEALVEQYNDQLRELREAGLSEQAEEVREALRALRDEERAPESSVKVPDIMSLQRPQDLTLEEGVAAVVKFGLGNLFSLAAKV